MGKHDLSTFVDEVHADVMAGVGRPRGNGWRERCSRGAVIDRWLERPTVTLYLAERALRPLRAAIARLRAGQTQRPAPPATQTAKTTIGGDR